MKEGGGDFADVLYGIPAKKLNVVAREILSGGLNQQINLTTTTDLILPRDYRGLAILMNIDFSRSEKTPDPTEYLLAQWDQDANNSVGKLVDMLRTLDRFDVADDLITYIAKMNTTVDGGKSGSTSTTPDTASFLQELGVTFVSRSAWNARPAKSSIPLKTPLTLVFLHHTGQPSGNYFETVRDLQEAAMTARGSPDIEYNFVLSPDGTVFEGTGWRYSSLVRRFSKLGIAVALIGDYDVSVPQANMIKTLSRLIILGVQKGVIAEVHGVYGHCDVDPSSSPGKNVIEIIRNWPRYRAFGRLQLKAW